MNWRFEINEWRAAGGVSALTALGGALLAAVLAAAVPYAHSQETHGPRNFAAEFDAVTAMLPTATPVQLLWTGPDDEWPGMSRVVPPVMEPNPASETPPIPASPPPPDQTHPPQVVQAVEGDLCTRHGLHKRWINQRYWRCVR